MSPGHGVMSMRRRHQPPAAPRKAPPARVCKTFLWQTKARPSEVDEKLRNFHVLALHHVQLAMPAGAEDTARAFYAGVLGLREVGKPAELAGRGGVWFAAGSLALHLGTEEPFIPATKAHPALAVTDLDAAHATLPAPSAISALPGLRRFYIADPFGNRIEIVAPT